MTPQERLEVATAAIKQYPDTVLDSIDDYSAEDLARIAGDNNVDVKDMPRLVGIMIYIRQRLVEKKSRVESFKIAFPERCIVTGEGSLTFAPSGDVGEPLGKSSIDTKAKRLENSSLYISIYSLMQTNLYIMYALDRIKVLDEALDIALDHHTPLRDKDRYMKLFLDETRKPKDAVGMEVNFNLTQNNVSIESVESKLSEIATSLKGATAADVIDAVYIGGSDDTSS